MQGVPLNYRSPLQLQKHPHRALNLSIIIAVVGPESPPMPALPQGDTVMIFFLILLHQYEIKSCSNVNLECTAKQNTKRRRNEPKLRDFLQLVWETYIYCSGLWTQGVMAGRFVLAHEALLKIYSGYWIGILNNDKRTRAEV